PDDIGDFYRVNGTSFAAPYVAGALALMLDIFPNMAPEDAISALLDSAQDYVDANPDIIRGEEAGVGTDSISGVGILDLAAAFAPQGSTSFTINGKVSPTAFAIAPAQGAFGDWASQPGAFDQLVFTDRFNRAYRFDAASILPRGEARIADFDQRADSLVGQSRAFRHGPVSFAWHQPAFRDDRSVSFDEAPQAQFTATYLFSGGGVEFGRGYGAKSLAPDVSLINEAGARTGFSEGGWARFSREVGENLAFEVFSSDDEDLSVSGVGLSRIEGNWGLRGQVSSLRDDRTALGGFIQSRFGGEDSSQLSAYAVEGAWKLDPRWRFSAGVEAASVSLPGMDTNNVWTSRWSVGADTFTPVGKLGLVIAQPRRAETGSLRFDGVTGLDESFAFITRTIDAPLTPSGREVNYEASWQFNLAGGFRAGMTAALSTEPNHVADAESASVYWFNVSKTW
ncbi:MAG: S8 family serine peptidase, partial [Henriciella sp.]